MVDKEALRLYRFKERCKMNQEKVEAQRLRSIEINRIRLEQWKAGMKHHNKVAGYEPSPNMWL